MELIGLRELRQLLNDIKRPRARRRVRFGAHDAMSYCKRANRVKESHSRLRLGIEEIIETYETRRNKLEAVLET